MATIVYLPGVVLAGGAIARTAIVLGWLAAAAVGMGAVRSLRAGRAGDRAARRSRLESVAAQVFLVGLLPATGLLVSLLANMPSWTAPGGDDDGPFAYYLRGVVGTSIGTLLVIAGGFGLVYILARRLIDVNLFSRCTLDVDRLTRCYLGASRPFPSWRVRWSQPRDSRKRAGAPSLADPAGPVRNPDRLTGCDSEDDLELRSLCIGQQREEDRAYWGPHLLLNTTRSGAGDMVLGRRTFEAEPFLLSPLYCGSPSLGYARTEDSKPAERSEPNLSLGLAMAIAGGADVSGTSPLPPGALAALHTLFCARPGYWIEKPKPDGWAATSPRFGELPAAASHGLAGDAGEFVYLTGGAEFDGLGVYELIRRRCRYIIAVDAGTDGGVTDTELAKLIRRCRIDFGLRIEINVRPLERQGRGGGAGASFGIGQVHYGDVDQGGAPGVLVYFKPSLTDDAPRYLPEFGVREPRPDRQRARLRQEPAEVQFERDRDLGRHIASAVFGDAAKHLCEELTDAARQPHGEYVARLFASLNESWGATGQAEGAGELVPTLAGVPSERERVQRESAVAALPAREVPPEPPSASVGRGRGRGAAASGTDAGTGRR
jgi:hypothetical protein